MIFQTNNNDSSIITFLQARKLAEQELTATIQQKQAILVADESALKLYESEISKGAVSTERFATIMQGASIEAQKYAISTQGVAGSTKVFVTSQQKAIDTLQKTEKSFMSTSMAAKAQSVALKSVSVAANMLVFTAIIKGIELLGRGLDYLAHYEEKASEKADELYSKSNDILSYLSSRIICVFLLMLSSDKVKTPFIPYHV